MRTAFECTHNLIVIWYSFKVDRQKRNTQTRLCSFNQSLEKPKESENEVVVTVKLTEKECWNQNKTSQNNTK